MKKADLIAMMAETMGAPKASVAQAFDQMIDAIKTALRDGETVEITGFGQFSVKDRAARTGRNPQTGEKLEIAASKAVAFKAAKGLKDAVANQ